MATAGDHLELIVGTVTATYGVQNLNVYHYEIGSITNPLELAVNGQDVADAWVEEMGSAWSNIVHEQSFMTDITINNLDDPDDFFVGVFTEPVGGSNTGDPMPPYVAWGFKLNRTTRQTRNGAKRIGMISEGSVTAGIANSGVTAALNAFALKLEIPLSLVYLEDPDETIVLNPVILGKREPDPNVYNPVSSAVYRAVSTQNTRKFGRGA